MIEEVHQKRTLDVKHGPVAFEKWDGRRHFERLARYYGIWPRCCLIYKGGQFTHGMAFEEIVNTARSSDLLLIIGGRLCVPDILENAPCVAYIDQNPAKTQVYNSEYGVDYGFDRYDYFFTVGLNIGSPTCEIPDCGKTWHGILHPVLLSSWEANIDESPKAFTTISTWAGRHTFKYNGRFSGEKADQWLRFIAIPKKTRQALEISLSLEPGYETDFRLFKENGWTLSDAGQIQTLEDYKRYISDSRAEFSVANNRYVEFKTGWFSDRSARYLAAGKPVLVQSTGIDDHLPTGNGLLTFSTMEEAVAGIEAINGDYPAHCRAARALAEEYLDSTKVLSRMLSQIGV
jgi:hypothetical protein